MPFSRFSAVFLTLLLAVNSICFAQKFTVTGKVTDESNSPLPGAMISEVGTKNGVVSNVDGNFSIDVSSLSASLEIRLMSMVTQVIPIDGRNIINVVLKSEIIQVDEVVVTALGITKESKSLGYSVTAVNSSDISQKGDKNMLTALEGRIAGVNISSSSGAPGASTRILMRGISSLSGSNQPLFVIDGVPISNAQSGSSSINGGTDFGNKINDLNMDDIESVSFLKGASGTALYGSRASSGVIIITTKKGKEKTKARVTYSGQIGFENPLRLVEYQNSYGQGIYGNLVLYENMSWGPAFDSHYRPWGHAVDSTIQVKAYRALPTNVRDFFETGMSVSHALSVSGGSDATTYYLSYSYVTWDGIFPAKTDSYKKHTVSIRGSQNVGKYIQVSAAMNYILKDNSYIPTGQSNASVYNMIMQTPRDISLLEQQDLSNIFNTIDNHYSIYTVNPYYILYNNGNKNHENRVFGNLALNVNLPLNLKAIWRVGAEISDENNQSWREKIVPKGNNLFSSVYDPGMRSLSYANYQQLNSDIILSWEKSIKDFSINLMAGQSANERKSSGFGTSVSYLNLEGFHNLSNTLDNPSSEESSAMVRLLGLYGGVDLSWKSILFLSGTFRNEWSSTLPTNNNSYFFPGVNTSIVITDLIPALKKFIYFGKLRASWARVGNGAPPYSINPAIAQSAQSDGYGYFSFPTITGINSYEIGDYIANPKLGPEMTTEIEFGGDLRFFNNRLAIDAAYYNKITKDLIWASPMAYSSGYRFQMQNLGELKNYGLESLINIVPIRKSKFKWELGFNYTRNFNKLVYLNNELDKAELNALRVDGGQQITWLAMPNKPVGVFMARAPLYTSDGKMVVDNQGLPKAAPDLKIYGNSQYKYYGGITNTFTYQNISLKANVDFRIGGIMYSRTKDITLWAGTVPATLYNNRQPFIIPNSVYEAGTDKNGNPIYVENTTPIDHVKLVEYWGSGGSELDGASFIDRSFVKLREVSIGYNLPDRWAAKMKMSKLSLGVSGKNLLLWTPKKQTYIDPELTTFGNDLLADFGEYGAQPSVRSISFNIQVEF